MEWNAFRIKSNPWLQIRLVRPSRETFWHQFLLSILQLPRHLTTIHLPLRQGNDGLHVPPSVRSSFMPSIMFDVKPSIQATKLVKPLDSTVFFLIKVEDQVRPSDSVVFFLFETTVRFKPSDSVVVFLFDATNRAKHSNLVTPTSHLSAETSPLKRTNFYGALSSSPLSSTQPHHYQAWTCLIPSFSANWSSRSIFATSKGW